MLARPISRSGCTWRSCSRTRRSSATHSATPRVVLEQDPANPSALSVAASAARHLGEDVAADGYERLAEALGATGPRVVAGGPGGELDAEIDAFFRNEVSAAEDGIDFERSAAVLADVAGMASAKAQIERSFLGPLRNPELRRMYQKSLRGGMLLYGPPGCGKTFLARARGRRTRREVPHDRVCHDTLDMWMGQSERNLHDAFERAHRNAPCVLFLDEIDALGQKRTNLPRSVMRNTVVQLLTELDGLDEVNEGLFVIGAATRPWDVDPALRRPGRFDRAVLVLPPEHRRTPADPPAGPARKDLSIRRSKSTSIAKVTDQRGSGADLNLVCESATECTIEDSLDYGYHPHEITQRDLEHATRGSPERAPHHVVRDGTQLRHVRQLDRAVRRPACLHAGASPAVTEASVGSRVPVAPNCCSTPAATRNRSQRWVRRLPESPEQPFRHSSCSLTPCSGRVGTWRHCERLRTPLSPSRRGRARAQTVMAPRQRAALRRLRSRR